VPLYSAFAAYLDKDRLKFGGNVEDEPAISAIAATWQESVDGIIDSQDK